MVKVDFTSGDILNNGKKVGNVFLTFRRNGYVVVSEIKIIPQYRGMGFGQQAMEQIIDYANKNNQILALTPSSDFGANKNKLIKWYKSLGFVLNKGRNKDFQTMETMYKLPDTMNENFIDREIWQFNEGDGNFNLKEFENLTSFAARIRYVEQHLKRIASGSARIVYEIDPTKVLKLAKNPKGIAQNGVEINMGMHDYYAKDYVTEVFDADENNGTWLVAEKAKKITPSRFYQITGVNIKDLSQWLDYNYFSDRGRSSMWKVSPEIDEKMWDNDFSTGILDMMKNYDLPSGDLGRISSYGEVVRNGQPDVVLTDYGLTGEVWSKHYEKRKPLYAHDDKNVNELADTNMEDELTNFIVGREKWDGGYGGFALMPREVDESFIHEAKIETDIGWFDVDERLAPQQSDLFISHLEVFDKGKGHFKELLSDIEEFARKTGKKVIVLEPDITKGGEYRKFLEDLYKRYGFSQMPDDPSLMIKSLNEGLADELITKQKINTPIGKIFSFGVNEDYVEDYRNISNDILNKSVSYVENFDDLRGNLGSHISDIYKNYLINVQNISDALKFAINDVKYYEKLMKIQDFLKKFGLVKEGLDEDLNYSHVTDASPEKDVYKLGENGTSLFMTQHGSDGQLQGEDIDEDQTLIKTHELNDVMDTIRGTFGIVSPHRLTNNAENNKNSKTLQNFLKKFNFNYTIGIGEWDDDTDTHEQSFIIKKPEKLSNKNFFKTLRLISNKFNQDAFIVGEDEKAFLVSKDGSVEEIGNSIEFTNNNYVGFDFISEEQLNEAGAGINRLMNHMQNNDFAIMSANRNENTMQQNKQSNDQLSRELQGKRAGFVNLIGHWEEIKTGYDGGDGTVNVREQSFFIPKPVDMETEEFKNWIVSLGDKFNQDAVLIGTPEEGTSLHYMNGSVEKKGKPSLLNINKAYSQLRRKPDATFVFEGKRIKTWMPKMTTPVIKKSCRLGGKADGTSDDCSQGDTGVVSYKKINDGQSHKPNKPNVAEDEKWFDKKIDESVIKRKENDEIFDYSSAKEEEWSEPIKRGKEFYKVNFDLENNDSTKQKKTIYVNKNLRKDQPIKYEINAELWKAGGDWEYPVMYFKIELSRDYGLKLSNDEKKALKKPEFPWDVVNIGRKHIMIPPVEAGNKLTKYRDNAKDKYNWAAWQDDYLSEEGIDEKEIRIADEDMKKAWKWLEDTIESAVDKRHKMLDESTKKKSLLREEKIEYGALMLYFDIPKWNNIINKVKEEDLYDDGSGTFGKENEPHITILYGFHPEVNGDDFKDIVNKIDKPIKVELEDISLFENPEFDVVKINVKPTKELLKLRKEVEDFPSTLVYKDYKPHMTIAYVKKGEGKKYIHKFKNPIVVESDLLVYSDKNKNQTQFPLNKNKSELKESYIGNLALEVAKKNNLYVVESNGKKYISVWHGTSPANHKKILNSGKFKAGSYFAIDEETAKKYGKMLIRRGQPVIGNYFIDAEKLFWDGNYFSINQDVYYNNGLYENVTKSHSSTYNNSMNINENILTLNQLPFKDVVQKMGGKIYSVGGAVRDEFLGKNSKDLDILITGIAMDNLENILSSFGKVDPVGKSFGILKFVPKGSNEDIDIAIPRTETTSGEGGHKGFDVSSDHNLPIEKDLERRDFTINAIAKDIGGNIIDPFGGQEDLKKKLIRLVNPQAFSDDPLRMIRAVQFSSRFGFKIEPKTMRAIQENSPRIKEISPERILIEFDKIVKKGDALTGAILLKKTGLMREIFGRDEGILLNENLWKNIKSIGEFIWLISHNLVDDSAEFYKRNLKGDIPTYKQIKAIDSAMKNVSDNKIKNRGIVSMMNSISPDSLKSNILPNQIKLAINDLTSGKYPLSLKQLKVNGNDLIQLGLKGRQIGQTLNKFLMNVYADKVNNDKQSLLNFLNNK